MVTLLTIGIIGMLALALISLLSILMAKNDTLELVLFIAALLLVIGAVVVFGYSYDTNLRTTYILKGKVDHTCNNLDGTAKVILVDGGTIDMMKGGGNVYYPETVDVNNGDTVYLRLEKDVFGMCTRNCFDIKEDVYNVKEILTQSKYQHMCFITDPGLCNPTVIML